jgi:hypothetical protein
MRARSREQKLVDLLFQCVLTVSDPEHASTFSKKTTEERAAWVAQVLRDCGFETTPICASWGTLVPRHVPDCPAPSQCSGCA